MAKRSVKALRKTTCLVLALAPLTLSASVLPAFAANPTPFLPHRAIYDLKLGKASGSQAPSAARGRIVYEFSGSACEGYVTNFRQITELQMEEGQTRMSDMRSATFEEGDGSGFRFKTDTFIDGRLMEALDGKALKAADGALSVEIAKPAPAKTDLAPGALFPTAQMQMVIAAAKAGERTAEVPIFDGSDSGQKIFDTMSVIGPAASSATAEKVPSESDALRDLKRWPVTVSYFDPAKQDGAPNYVLAFDIYENGVSGRLRIDYGAYTLNGEMSKFEVLPQKPCDK
jgi:hypothetical protein